MLNNLQKLQEFSASCTKFILFRTAVEYLEEMPLLLCPDSDILAHPLYSTMVNFLLREKTPLFYFAEDEKERVGFTTSYSVIGLARPQGHHANPTMFSLMSLHEAVHGLFEYPRTIEGMSSGRYDESMIVREAVASNATEVFVHYDIPSLRERLRDILPRIWFDILQELGYFKRPTITQLLDIRRAWLDSDAFDYLFCRKPEDQVVAQFMGRWRNGNERYWHKRMQKLRSLPTLAGCTVNSLGPFTYEEQLHVYQQEPLKALGQDQYERLQVHHARTAFAIAGRLQQAPASFNELWERREELDGLRVVIE